MAGARLPSDAAKALGVSQPRYYLLESRAMNGLIAACELRQKGRVRSTASELASAQQQIKRLQQDCARYSALARVAQRTIGLNAPQPVKAAHGKKYHKGVLRVVLAKLPQRHHRDVLQQSSAS
jgi:hypothetical protein